ncbi:MAG: amidohydrolase [Betaproteobacteria bacterium]|nr:amidohydrolase [Betaproteobacteria bacterium]
MIIDCHVHLFESLRVYSKEEWNRRMQWRRRWLGEEEFEKWQAAYSGTVESLIEDMNEAGVDRSVVFASGPFKGEPNPEVSIWECNEYVADAQRKYPDRIIGFVRLDLSRPVGDTLRLLEKGVAQWGLKGVKIIPDRPLGDESCREVMDRIIDLDLPVLVHMGAGATPMPFYYEHGNPEVLSPLIIRYPRMRIVAAHLASGFEDVLTEIISARRVGTIFGDISGWQNDCSKSHWHFTLKMRHLMDKIPDKIIMGSDWPGLDEPSATWGPFGGLSHKEWFDAVRNLKIPEKVLELGWGMRDFSAEEKNKILGDNAKSWLGFQL